MSLSNLSFLQFYTTSENHYRSTFTINLTQIFQPILSCFSFSEKSKPLDALVSVLDLVNKMSIKDRIG